ncbi:hypothetical protein M0802_009568, partial [Mischocyttarus mexicanus]
NFGLYRHSIENVQFIFHIFQFLLDFFTSDPTNSMNTKKLNKPCCESIFDFCDDFNDKGEKKRTKIPKIYYATRTHRQIKQVVKELARTVYKNTK